MKINRCPLCERLLEDKSELQEALGAIKRARLKLKKEMGYGVKKQLETHKRNTKKASNHKNKS